jgi:hypothetical protein
MSGVVVRPVVSPIPEEWLAWTTQGHLIGSIPCHGAPRFDELGQLLGFTHCLGRAQVWGGFLSWCSTCGYSCEFQSGVHPAFWEGFRLPEDATEEEQYQHRLMVMAWDQETRSRSGPGV